MKDFSKQVKMSNPNLPRVNDLEKSPEWVSLANEINDLEKMCHLNNHRRSKKQLFKYHNCHRHSMPQVQKAKSVWIEPSDELNEGLEQNHDLSRSDADETYRWNWRPKTEFERTYFFEDYSQNHFHEDRQKRYSSLPYSETFAQRMEDQRSTEYQKAQSPLLQVEQSQSSLSDDKLGRVYNGINGDGGPSHSGTRERIHEIFERNRYLRRKFFASMPDNDAANYVADFPKSFDNKNPATVSKYNNSGFGSTETLASQSNQSSISSINDRKSRGQVNITPELIEEERCPGDFFQGNDYSKNTSMSDVNRVPGGNVTSGTKESKLLVNILSGNEVYVLKDPTSSRDTNPARNYGSNETMVPGPNYQVSGKMNVEVKQYNTNNRYTPNAWSIRCEQLNSKDEIVQQNVERESDFEHRSRNRVCTDDRVPDRETKSLDYLTKISPNQKRTGQYDFPYDEQDKISHGRNTVIREHTESVDTKHLHELQSDCKPKRNIFESKSSVQPVSYVTSIENDVAPVVNRSSSWTKQAEMRPRQALCKSLPNLSFFQRTSNFTLPNRTINDTDSSSVYGGVFQLSSDVASTVTRKRIVDENPKHFASQIDISTVARTEPMSLTSRRVKIAKVPPPLDLSRVNEKYEELEAYERRQLNNYTVDVSLVRNYDCPLQGQPAIIKDEYPSDDNHDASVFKDDSLQQSSCSFSGERREEDANETRNNNDPYASKRFEKGNVTRNVHKSCGDLFAMDDLQSPQLVNNYKNSMIDLRSNDSGACPARDSLVIGDETTRDRNARASLSDHVNSIGGLQAGAGTTLPSVYGPIPYSQ